MRFVLIKEAEQFVTMMKNFKGLFLQALYVKVSISSTFYVSVFLYESNLNIFSLITIWLGDILAKGYRQKSARKMLMILTHFINTLRTKKFVCTSFGQLFLCTWELKSQPVFLIVTTSIMFHDLISPTNKYNDENQRHNFYSTFLLTYYFCNMYQILTLRYFDNWH